MTQKVVFFEAYPDSLLGQQRVLLELLLRLDRQKIEPILICPGAGGLTEAIPEGIELHILPPKGILQERNWMTHNKLPKLLKSPWLILEAIWNLLLYWQQLRQFFQQIQCKLVYCNSFRATLLAGVPARLAGIKTILHEHTSVIERPNILLRFCYWLSERVIFVSQDMLNKLVTHPDSKKFTVIYNGVDLSSDSSYIQPPENHPPSICFIGTLTPRKNVHVLIEAIASLQTTRAFHLLIVGDGEVGYTEKLQQQVKELGLDKIVTFYGRQENVIPFLLKSTLLVLPSSQESFGLVLLEAYSVQRPVIATTVGGIPEVVIDGETGLLIPPNDPDALTNALEKLLFNRELAVEMGRSGYKLLQNKFTLQQNVERISQLIVEIIKVKQ